MTRLTLAVACFVIIFPPGTPAQQAEPKTDPCGRVKLPITLPPDLKLEVVNHFLTFRPEVVGTVFLRNTTGKPINGITMLINYEDKDGSTIFAIPYQADTETGDDTATNIRHFFRGMLTRPVQPGEVFDLLGTTLLAASEVPAKAEVSVIDLRTGDEGLGNQLVGKVRSDPILEKALPEYLKATASRDDLPEDVLLKLRISARGAVTDISLLPSSKAKPGQQIVTLAMDQLRRWRFFPAVREGLAETSELTVLLRFRRQEEPPVRECFIGQQDKYPNVFAIVTAKSIPGPEGSWTFFYAKYEVSGRKDPFLGRQVFESAIWPANNP